MPSRKAFERGLIRAIDAFMHNLPYGASSGWE